jgi:hypothetical protein
MRARILVFLLAVSAALLLRPPQVSAQAERIVDFHSDVTVQGDGSLVVTETITVEAAGNQIRHGIYREFPTRYRDPYNNSYVVGFQMLGATRDGSDEPFRVEDRGNGKRIYLGDPNALVPRGPHVYTLTYGATRLLGLFKDHDELFWNVTGNGWGFVIQQASATVHLPAKIPVRDVTLSGFTGPQGSSESELTRTRADSAFQFAATRKLGPHEGLTILLMWPKGYFSEPTTSERIGFFLHDNSGALLLMGGFVALFLYYFMAWSAVGRDPEKGVIMPFYEPPQELSPAGMRYLMRMSFDNKTFASAILDMAVRGFLTIKNQAGSYTLCTTGKENRALTPDEKQVAACLFDGRSEIWLHNENHQTISAAIKALKKGLAAAEQKIYFVTNARYMIAPVILSIVILLAYLLSMGGPQTAMGVFICFWLTFWSIGVSALMFSVYRAWQNVLHPASQGTLSGVTGIAGALFVTLFSIPFLGGEGMGFFFLFKLGSPVLLAFVIGASILHALFFHLLKAPTFAGRRLMDKVAGFKLFLGAVDGDRLNRMPPPEQSTAVFEKFLPYAMALDVENHWAEKFSAVLAAAGTTPGNNSAAYAPTFYSGGGSDGFSGAGFATSFGSSLTSAISSSAMAPGSGGGGSGGSGGGGGGGGGGGW